MIAEDSASALAVENDSESLSNDVFCYKIYDGVESETDFFPMMDSLTVEIAYRDCGPNFVQAIATYSGYDYDCL